MNAPEIIKQSASGINVTDIIICLAGLILFGSWLLKTSFGRSALVNSVPRRNNMPLYLPFIPLFVWFGAVSVGISITRNLKSALPDWQSVFLDNLILCIGATMVMAVIIFLVRVSFARRLKGFGLNFKTILKDLPAAFVNLLSVWPIVILMILVTRFFGKLIWGPEFQIQQHEELKTIIAHPELPVRVLIIVATVAIIPVFEEMLFRGLFQTMIRSFLGTRRSSLVARGTGHKERVTDRNRACLVRSNSLSRTWPALLEASRKFLTGPASGRTFNGAWLSIVITSTIFAMVHLENPEHWPALFALSVCMGYAYEKSGSLFRPIFIHSLFNAISIIAVLYSV